MEKISVIDRLRYSLETVSYWAFFAVSAVVFIVAAAVALIMVWFVTHD